MIGNKNEKPKALYACKMGNYTIISDDNTDRYGHSQTIFCHQRNKKDQSNNQQPQYTHDTFASRSRFWQLNSLCDILQLKQVVETIRKNSWFELKKPSLNVKTVKKIRGMSGEPWMNFVLLDSKLSQQINISEHNSDSDCSSL